MKFCNLNNNFKTKKGELNMKNLKTKVLVVALALCLVAIASLGTMAWFTDSDSVNNDFFIAGSEDNDPDEIFSVDVWEDSTPDDPDGEAKEDSIRFDDVLPGDDLYKEVNIENTGSYDQYIRATVTVTGASVWQKLFGDTYFPLSSLATDLNADFVVDRTVYNADEDTMTYVLYYKNILPAKQGNVVTLFTNVAIPEAMTREDAAALVEDGKFQINVVADAIQTENVGNSAIEAFKTAKMYDEAGEFTVVENAATLAAQLANAAPGTVIDLVENVNYDTVTLDELKDVTIEGAKGARVIIRTDADTKLENVTLKGIEFEYTGATADCGIVIDGNAQIDNLVVDGCTFTGTGAKAGRGLSGFNNNASIVLTNCTFEDLGYPIYAWGGYKSLEIDACTFKNIKSWAVMPQSGFDGDLTVNNCKFVDCLGGGLVKAGTLTAGHTFTFTNNTITGCTIAGDHNWFQFKVSAGTTVISGNTMDGADWTPGTAEGLK